jgi:hypothetical protein
MTTMSADIPAPAKSRVPLAVGDPVQVIAATYSGVRVGTVARIARVRPRRGKGQPELYEIDGYPECVFWRRELARA